MGELQGWALMTLIHPEDLEGIVKKWRASVASGDPFLREARLRRADGQYRWFSIVNVPMRDEADRIVRWFGAGHDMEERKQREDRLLLLVDSTPVCDEHVRKCMFPVNHVYDGFLVVSHHRGINYCGR
jgi:PAS domain-containing protein